MAFFVFVAIFGSVLAPYSATQQSGPVYAPPSTQHWLGTDDSGVDVLSELMVGWPDLDDRRASRPPSWR